ncbi:hypothetical protein FPZ12_018050 [Amycolatopsis acidicola]|uniref:Uncharacterized protein n=1 Tax=Amycolatopsis acidicola TaxID=2596893 RepID=A0A5N0V1B4_9PSEU|nr:hypothetical protein [Amycolatopsis acidicola]KAA9160249.1 hypothetical protein FPZ12_018050 [Amycolatopsis acidicola]
MVSATTAGAPWIIPLGSAFGKGEIEVRQLGELTVSTYDSLPPEQRAHTAVFAEIYPFAAAAEYSGQLDVYSGHRGYWYFGPPPESVDSVLFAGFDPNLLRPYFTSTTPVVDGLMWLYTGKNQPWRQFWPALRTQ